MNCTCLGVNFPKWVTLSIIAEVVCFRERYLLLNYPKRFSEALVQFGQWVKEGKLKVWIIFIPATSKSHSIWYPIISNFTAPFSPFI